MRPESGQIIYYTACGTGGFLLASYNYITNNYHPDKERKKRSLLNLMPLKERSVDAVAKLCLMDMYLHGIGGEDNPVAVGHPLIADIGERINMIVTNPNFGKKSSITVFGRC
jgi:type I restriction enzyme M protein